MITTPHHYATIWEAIADRVPDAPAFRHGTRLLTWGAFEERAARLAGALLEHGIGVREAVGAYLYNYPEYFEVYFAAWKIRARPFNSNHRYRSKELLHLLSDSGARALFYDAALRDRVASAIEEAPGVELLVEVGEGGAGPSIPGSQRYEELLAAAKPASRIERPTTDHYLNYTGGTTGLPKGVMVEVGGSVGTATFFRNQYVQDPDEGDPVEYAVRHARSAAPLSTIPASPVAHGVGFLLSSLPTLVAGGSVVTLDSHSFDPDELLRTVGETRARVLAIVGDAFALPIVRALDAGPPGGGSYDASSLRIICSAGAAWSAQLKARLLEHLPNVTLVDACGSTEGVTYGVKRTRAGDPLSTANFQPAPGLRVISPEGAELPPGEVGLLAGPTHSRGYHSAKEESARTFVTFDDGSLCAVPGDLGRIEPDGSVTLIGRGVSTINTGGEKVHPGEVEEAIRALDHVDDCAVLGIAHERFGQAVAALVAPQPGQRLEAEQITRDLRRSLAGYKVPSRLRFVDEIPRTPNGKVDYKAATALVESEAPEETRTAEPTAGGVQ